MDKDLFRICVHIENRTLGTGALTSNAVMPHSFVSTHTILHVHQGSFISLLDPPEALKSFTQDCNNVHTWPVLIGNEGEYDTMLSSPIILYDYPQIAPESPGSLFDGTEIDEILALRIMTLTDEEKAELRQGDARAREILERTEALSPEQMMKLHGVIRSLRPVDEESEHEQHK
jgi:hydrogenase maturation protease